MTQPADNNPYAPPATVSKKSPLPSQAGPSTIVQRLIALHVVVIIVALVLEHYHHETIVPTGGVFLFTGLAVAVVARRRNDLPAVFLGMSAAAFTALIVFLINWNRWGPPEGDRPITILSYLYASLALPAAWWLFFRVPNDTAATRQA